MSKYVWELFSNVAPKHFIYWKHSLPPLWFLQDHPQEPAIEKLLANFPGVMFICMVRSPYYWVASTCRRSYDILFHVRSPDLGLRLRSPVTLRGQRFKNIVQLWNCYYHNYAVQLEVNHQVEYICLEDLVRNPANTLRTLETWLQPRPDHDPDTVIAQLTAKPMKPHNAFGTDWEEKNRLQHLCKTISNHDLTFITQELDQELMRKFNYPTIWTEPDIY